MQEEFRSFTSPRGIHILSVFRRVLLSRWDDASFAYAVETRLRMRACELMEQDPSIGLATALRQSLIEWRECGNHLPREEAEASAPTIFSEHSAPPPA
ncbi:TPA: hypothetical protein DEP34_05155 [Candidatus Uhrbacteria bacterium]|uniref:Uncharacterized protein n=2 Tax=Candidatus Uhriibacteriota TaxID=1752732 RepID=A0A0G1Q5P3_9BACT|nr:MAG: hypothetical protein UX45_C0029G0007 [Candidatus Uhrbacteria bacterium GW2011_GWF2_46_218]KKU40299.1 MAG: hypothetical protein UX57_C0020G0007 [Candidatus Uhrbacteria bacterium GW2011_GWE2_46_68]HBK33434.1 hypothetical protein [Candidatus Uhrbacteria bacterium]HCB19727.1 hypothetical protein [Candidatus Uhrbacteria bacterium]